MANGKVVRRRPAHNEATRRRARESVHQMAQAQARQDPILQFDLENISVGCDVGKPPRADVVIRVAESALSQHHAQRRAAAREEAARPVLTVHRRFRAIGGREYAVGEYRID